jgi:hypothetical protein
MEGMARRAVLARVVAGGTHLRETMAIEEIGPMHAEQTSQRDVPTRSKTLNTYADLVSKAGRLRFNSTNIALQIQCDLFFSISKNFCSPECNPRASAFAEAG